VANDHGASGEVFEASSRALLTFLRQIVGSSSSSEDIATRFSQLAKWTRFLSPQTASRRVSADRRLLKLTPSS